MSNRELGWVIESGDSEPCAPKYWAGHFSWSADHLKAIRFARMEDAKAVADSERDLADGPAMPHRIAEHVWDDGK